jgi:hypothetical protein
VTAPVDALVVEPGEVVAVTLDVISAADRPVVHAIAILDGALVGEADAAPFAFDIVVPPDAAPGAVLPLVAQVWDDLGAVGTSPAIHLTVAP